jgi:hypothetical protein
MKLLSLTATGPSKPAAQLMLGPELNVIQGAANTGKSHVVGLIDFMLGAGEPPTTVTEQAGYDTCFLSLESNGKVYTLCRRLAGGEIRKADGIVLAWPADGRVLAQRHGSSGNSLSEFLLAELGIEDKKLKKNARGDTVSLSFRHLAHLVIVSEGDIQDATPPLERGQNVNRTEDLSAFKFVLTGQDDHQLTTGQKEVQSAQLKRAHQLELLDKQISDVDAAIAKDSPDPSDLVEQQNRLSEALTGEIEQLESTGGDYRQLVAQRRVARNTREHLLDRLDEIALLLARFSQLDAHYLSDIARLEGIEEAGSFFVLREHDTCPLCGADQVHHRTGEACDGDVETIRAAARTEIDRISLLRTELHQVIEGLSAEEHSIKDELPKVDKQLRQFDIAIQRELPDFRAAKNRISEIVSTKTDVQRKLSLFQRKSELLDLRGTIGDVTTDATSLIAEAVLDGRSKDEFAKHVQALLKEWGYPTEGRVFFDLKTRDIEIAGKLRRANGKGVRAILHSAFTLGLAKYCKEHQLPHPGFVILDSPLVTYRDPLEADEKRVAESDLKGRFFKSVDSLAKDFQIIIFENVDLPSWLEGRTTTQIFTGNPAYDRAGFYPI